MFFDTHVISLEFAVTQECSKIGEVTVIRQCHQKLFRELKRAWKLVVYLQKKRKIFSHKILTLPSDRDYVVSMDAVEE